MSCFTKMSTVSADSESDLTKHVNYTAGMILGVDDFTQEFAYLAGRDRWLAREAIGYGTISGLSVRIEEDAGKGHRVVVAPGIAVSPRGQLICVPLTQCAYLNQWLAAADPKDLLERINAGELTLYVVLCYRDCLTDNVPVPGEPCRNSDELMAESRVKDDFSLELRFEPPKQLEEEAVREYSDFLRKIKISEDSSSMPIENFLQAIRDEFLPSGAPLGSPPVKIEIKPEDVAEYIRLAFRLWVTELRNVLSEKEDGCAAEMTGGKKLEDCVLLTRLRIPLESVYPGWKVSDAEKIEIDEKDRPFLLHLRMLQEWMLNEPNDHGALTGLKDDDHLQYLPVNGDRPMEANLEMGGHLIKNVDFGKEKGDVLVVEQGAGGDLEGTYPSPTIASLQKYPLSAQSPLEGQLLVLREKKWVTETFKHKSLAGLDKDDHPQYLLVDGTRPMAADLKMGKHQIKDLAKGTEPKDAAIVEQIVSKTDEADGDVKGIFSKLRVDKLQGFSLVADAPTEGKLLVFRNNRWIAVNDLGDKEKISGVKPGTAQGDVMIYGQTADGDLNGTYPNPTIQRLQGNPIDARSPKKNDALVWNGSAWVAGAPVSSGNAQLVLPFATIDYVQGTWEFDIWFNIDAPENQAEIKELKAADVFARMENEVKLPGQQSTFFQNANIKNISQISRNLFRLILEDHPASVISKLRFDFKTSIGVTFNKKTTTVQSYAGDRNIRFMGQSEDAVTVFVRVPGTLLKGNER